MAMTADLLSELAQVGAVFIVVADMADVTASSDCQHWHAEKVYYGCQFVLYRCSALSWMEAAISTHSIKCWQLSEP